MSFKAVSFLTWDCFILKYQEIELITNDRFFAARFFADKRGEKNPLQIIPCWKRVQLGDEKKTQWLREHAEEPGSVPRIHKTTHNHLNSSSRGSNTHYWPLRALCACGPHICIQVKHSYTQKAKYIRLSFFFFLKENTASYIMSQDWFSLNVYKTILCWPKMGFYCLNTF